MKRVSVAAKTMVLSSVVAALLTVTGVLPAQADLENERICSAVPPGIDPLVANLYYSGSVTNCALNPDERAGLNEIVDAAIADYEIPGIVFAIKPLNGDVYTAARGVANIDTGEALEVNDRFRIGSASKTFTGMSALRLISEGKLAFESTLDQFVDAEVLSNYPKADITVRMLLSHTSGINNYTNDIEDWFFPYIEDRTRVWTDEELVGLVNEKFDSPQMGQLFTPGAGWFYSNTNTVLLGMVVESITGQTIGSYITEQFIEPLGLTNTYYPVPGEYQITGEHTEGYMDWANFTGQPSLPSGLTNVTEYDPSGVGAAGPMVSTVRDLAIWMESIGNDTTLIGDLLRGHIDWRYYVSFSSSQPGESSGSYGMNLAHEPSYNNNANYWIVGHRGQISGFDTAMMYMPDQALSIVVVCNRSLAFQDDWPTNAATAAMNNMIGFLYPNLIAESQIGASRRASKSTDVQKSERARVPDSFPRAVPLNEYPARGFSGR